MAAPSFIQEAETVYNSATSPKTTASFSVQAGDVIVAYAFTSDSVSTVTISSTGGLLTFTLNQDVSTGSYTRTLVWTAVATGAGAVTISFAHVGSEWFGGNALTFRGSDGVGASSKASPAAGAPSLSLTTTQANSAIVVANGDWNAADGTVRTWRSVNGSPATETTYFRDSAQYTVYGGYHLDAGAIGAYTVGLSAPAGQKFGIVAQEVKGSAGGGGGVTVKQLSALGVG